MMFFSSSVVNSVSFLSWSTYVCAGLPLFFVPCFGSQSSICLTISSFLLHMCPTNFNPLSCSTVVMLLSFPYSSLFVLRSLQLKPRTALSIHVYVPSSLLFIAFVSVQLSAPYNRTLSTVALKTVLLVIYASWISISCPSYSVLSMPSRF
jgi:hypothetical protein